MRGLRLLLAVPLVNILYLLGGCSAPVDNRALSKPPGPLEPPGSERSDGKQAAATNSLEHAALNALELHVHAELKTYRECPRGFAVEISRKQRTLTDIEYARAFLDMGLPLARAPLVIGGRQTTIERIDMIAREEGYLVIFNGVLDVGHVPLDLDGTTCVAAIRRLCEFCRWDLTEAGKILIVTPTLTESKFDLAFTNVPLPSALSVLNTKTGLQFDLAYRFYEADAPLVTLKAGRYTAREAIVRLCEPAGLRILDAQPPRIEIARGAGELSDDELEDAMYNNTWEAQKISERLQFIPVAREDRMGETGWIEQDEAEWTIEEQCLRDIIERREADTAAQQVELLRRQARAKEQD